ncbi:tetratricopeptide repeat protein [Campylobacterota bacterium DY0563]
MDSLVLEYRDPLFGIIVFFTLIFIISFLTYSFSLYKEKKARKDYRKLLRRFEIGKLKEEDYVHLYKTYNLPFDSIILLASTFVHKGNYTKAISVYLTLLEHVTDRVKKEELLELLGSTYFKSGFMQRAKEIFLRILKFSPRNINALNYLLIINEKLKDYQSAQETIECLEEVGVDIKKDKIYIDTLTIINNPIESFEKKSEKLYEIFKENPDIQRLIVQFYLQYNKKFFWEHLNEFDFKKLIDLMWYLNFDDLDFDKIAQNKILNELYNAKGYLKTIKHSNDFVFDILIALNNHEHKIPATIDFEFMCSSCKQIHPIFDSRCPHCHSILTLNVKHNLVKSLNETNQSLQ